jgi:hypothetical protein
MDIGTTEWWCYIAGEYGGGSWTGARIGGDASFLTNPEFEDRFDYNDIRAFVGFEWTALSGVRGFFEGGYVFEREIVYQSGLPAVFDLEDTVMVRAGVVY